MKKLKKLLARHSFEVWKRELDFLFVIGKYSVDGTLIIPADVVDTFKKQNNITYESLLMT